MITPTIIWMRHGTCTDGARKPAAHPRPASLLHPRGIDEVTATATTLRRDGFAPTLVVASPLPRATASAEIAAEILGSVKVEHHNLLREWAAPDSALGRTPSEYPPDYLAWRVTRLQDVDAGLPGGESVRAVSERATAALANVEALAHRYRIILVVSHRLLIGCVAAVSNGIHEPAEVFTNACDMALAPAGVWRSGQQMLNGSHRATVSVAGTRISLCHHEPHGPDRMSR